MRQRWAPMAALAVGLFAVNVVARSVTRFGFDGDETAEARVSVAMFTVIGLTLAVVTFVRSQHRRPADWLPEVAVAAAGGLLLTVLIGPFVSGDRPFAGGAGTFFAQTGLYAGFAAVGSLLGYWLATALGRDHRSRTLRAYAQARAGRPRRVVRR